MTRELEEDRADRFRGDRHDEERPPLGGRPPRARRSGELLRATLKQPTTHGLSVVVELTQTRGDDRAGLLIETRVDWDQDPDYGNSAYRSRAFVAMSDGQARFALLYGPQVLQRGAPA